MTRSFHIGLIGLGLGVLPALAAMWRPVAAGTTAANPADCPCPVCCMMCCDEGECPGGEPCEGTECCCCDECCGESESCCADGQACCAGGEACCPAGESCGSGTQSGQAACGDAAEKCCVSSCCE